MGSSDFDLSLPVANSINRCDTLLLQYDCEKINEMNEQKMSKKSHFKFQGFD